MSTEKHRALVLTTIYQRRPRENEIKHANENIPEPEQ